MKKVTKKKQETNDKKMIIIFHIRIIIIQAKRIRKTKEEDIIED